MENNQNQNPEVQENQVDQSSAETLNTGEGQQQEQQVKMFTEEEVNAKIQAAIQDRLNRLKKKYDGVDEKLKRLEELEKLEEERKLANMSEMEKLQAQLEAATKEKQTYLQKLEELESKYRQDRLHFAFKEIASKHNIAYVDDALKLADLSGVEVDEEGNFVGLEDVVKNLVETKPFLLGQPPKPDPKPIGGPSNPNPEGTNMTNEQLLEAARRRYKETNNPKDMVAYIQLKRQLGLH